MKIIRRLILGILAAVILTASLLVYRGYREYRTSVFQKSTVMAVKEYTEKAGYLPFDEIDTDFVNAVIAVEDKRFFSRHGFDWVALIRALLNNLEAGRAVEGASTITQQVAKNLYYLDRRRGLEEKIAEVFMMMDLEQYFSKREIFALYANMNYYGDGYWGVKNASLGYFSKEPNDLSIAEAALLAGIPNAPGIYQLSTGYDRAMQRQKKVLRRMREEDMISEAEYQTALSEEIRTQ